MPTIRSIPFSRRKIEDVVVRDGERFLRGEIDRTIKEADFVFSTLHHRYTQTAEFGHVVKPGSHPENTPSDIATRIAKATGCIAIADVGCGTANSLMTWGRKVAADAGCELGNVHMTGISRQDYSNESMSASTVRALRGAAPLIRYVLGDAEDMPEIGPCSQDVTLAYNSLIYARQPDAWLSEMIRITKPGGAILFNSSFRQSEEGQPLIDLLKGLHTIGYPILRDNLMIPKTGPGAMNPQLQILEHMTDNTVLYRIDIPQT